MKKELFQYFRDKKRILVKFKNINKTFSIV